VLNALENAMFCQIIFNVSSVFFLQLRSCHIALMTFFESSSFEVTKINDVNSFNTLLICLNACFLNIELLLLIEEKILILFIKLSA